VNDQIKAQGKFNTDAVLKQNLGEGLSFFFCTGKVSTCEYRYHIVISLIAESMC
jgi:hypothetical protein